MVQLENQEDTYAEYTMATTDFEAQLLRNAWLFLKTKMPFVAHAQILHLLVKSRNNYCFSTMDTVKDMKPKIAPLQFTFRQLPDEKTLIVSCIQSKTQLAVCWVKDCVESSGNSTCLCCPQHDREYKSVLWLQQGELNTVKLSPRTTETAHGQERRNVDSLAHLKNPALHPLERILDAFTELGKIVWPKEFYFDPLISVTETRQNILAKRLTWNTFQYGDSRLTWDAERSSFLFMDQTDQAPSWKPICSELNCFVLASEGWKGCFSHPDKPSGKRLYSAVLLKVAEVKDICDFDAAARIKVKKALQTDPENRLQVAEGIYFYIRNAGNIGLRDGKSSFRLCENAGCINLVHSKLLEYCNECSNWSAALLYFPDSTPKEQFCSLRFRRSDMKLSVSDINLVATIERRLHGYVRKDLKGKFAILHMHHCESTGAAGDEEAKAWQTAYVIYGKIESFVLGRRAKFHNTVCEIGCCEWAYVQELCRTRGMDLVIGENLDVSPPEDYCLVSKEPNFSDQDYTKTVYKIEISSLVYIGQRTIFSAYGRENLISSKCHILEPERCRSGKIIDILRLEGYQGLGAEDLPHSTVAVVTASHLSPFVPETMLMLAYTLNEQKLKTSDMQLINKDYSSSEWTPSWFRELQYICQQLFGKTIQLKHAGLTDESSLLFGRKDMIFYSNNVK